MTKIAIKPTDYPTLNLPTEKGPRPLCFGRSRAGEKGPRPLFDWPVPKTKGSGTFFAVFFLVGLLCGVSADSVSAAVRLPLEGYCRPGRFFPIQIDGADATRELLLSAQGCLDSQVNAGAGDSRIVPMLATGTAAELKWTGGWVALLSLKDNERLVACTTDEIDASLFPGTKIISIRLDPADLLPGPPAAWESLDAVLLDASMFQRINDAQRSALLAGGVVLAARGEMPDDRWPWQHRGSLWILSPARAGPTDELVDGNAYAPTDSWAPGWSGQVRGQVMGIATLLLLVTTAILLVKPNRFTAMATISLSLLAAGGVIGWKHMLGSIDRAGGDIIVAGQGFRQRDSWVFQRAKNTSTQTVPWAGWTHPIFASSMGMAQADMMLQIAASGEMSFVYQASAAHTMAFVRREIEPGGFAVTLDTHDSPMQEAAKADYLRPGMRVSGETPAMNGRWPGVVISPR